MSTPATGSTLSTQNDGLALRAVDLVKTYSAGGRGQPVRALDGLGIGVPAGTVFGLLGPNGAGKSTTVKILATLSRPDSGAARVAGLDVVAHPNRVRQAIGYVSQRPGADPEATGRENLLLQGRLYGLRGSEVRSRTDALLARFGLTDAANRLVRTYSGGMQRKLDVALGLIHRPQVLFLDEPTTGLDPEARTDMWAEIERLSSQDGLTVLLTTHYLEEADRLAGRLAIVDAGRVVVEGTPDGLKSELRGDAVQVGLAEATAADPAQRILAAVDGVSDVVTEGRSLRARVDSGARAVPAVLSALDGGGVRVATVTVARPSLDDVYLRYAGRSFSAAESAAGNPGSSGTTADRTGVPA